jgi:hypothetical protein
LAPSLQVYCSRRANWTHLTRNRPHINKTKTVRLGAGRFHVLVARLHHVDGRMPQPLPKQTFVMYGAPIFEMTGARIPAPAK